MEWLVDFAIGCILRHRQSLSSANSWHFSRFVCIEKGAQYRGETNYMLSMAIDLLPFGQSENQIFRRFKWKGPIDDTFEFQKWKQNDEEHFNNYRLINLLLIVSIKSGHYAAVLPVVLLYSTIVRYMHDTAILSLFF